MTNISFYKNIHIFFDFVFKYLNNDNQHGIAFVHTMYYGGN